LSTITSAKGIAASHQDCWLEARTKIPFSQSTPQRFAFDAPVDAPAPLDAKPFRVNTGKDWSPQRDLNPRPPDYKFSGQLTEFLFIFKSLINFLRVRSICKYG